MIRENTLFSDITIKRLVSNINLTSKQKKASREWLELIGAGELKKEKANYLKFNKIILTDLLGYPDLAHEEENVEFAYNREGKSIVKIEVKGMDTKDLFLPQKRAKEESPVQQLWRYMQLHATPYGIVTNYNTFILFKYNVGSIKYYSFDFIDIKKNIDRLKEFLAIFSRESIDNEFVEELYEKSIIEEREFTQEFYKLYHETRLMLIREFEENSNISREASIHFAQLYLNRLMFVFFAEDTDKLERRIIENRILKTLESIHQFSSNSNNISNIIIALFNDLDKGSIFPVKIFGFNGGLFQHPIPPKIYFKDLRSDKFFNKIKSYSKFKKKSLDLNEKEKEIFNSYKDKLNPIIKNILIMASFDFNTEINVNILGHIFEQSLTDIEDLKNDKSSRRKKEGIFYTPEYITDYICRNTIIPYLSKKEVNEVPALIMEYADNIEELENKFKSIKILDPACGSGAFLIKAIDIMLEIFKSIQEFKQQEGEYEAFKLGTGKLGKKKLKNMQGQLSLGKWNEEDEAREIIENNIYGVDINRESIEITKLSLFLKMARKNRKLIDLSKNIKQGNSLIDDKDIAGDLAFDWKKEFPFKFDIIIGNPPYVRMEKIEYSERMILKKNYSTAIKRIDLYSIFIEKGYNLLNEGYLSFIVPNTLLNNDDFSELRKLLIEKCKIRKINILGDKVFAGATVSTIILNIKKSDEKNLKNKTYFGFDNFNLFLNKVCITQEDFLSQDKYRLQIPNKIIDKIRLISKNKVEDCLNYISGIQIWGNKSDKLKNPELYSKERLDIRYKQAIVGENINRYNFSLKDDYVLYDKKKLNRGRDEKNFLQKDKIVMRYIGKKIICSYDDNKNYALKSVIIFYPKNREEINTQYVLSIFNSKLIQYYYDKSLGEEKYPRINISYLLKVPIPKISLLEQKPFIEKADLMLRLNKQFYEKKDKFLKIIKHEYKINKISKILEKFYELNFDEFIKQLKISLNIEKKSELLDFFEKNKKELIKLKEEIEKTDKQINNLVYELYELTKKEIEIIEMIK